MIAYYACTKCETFEEVPVRNRESVPRCWLCGSARHVEVIAYKLPSPD